LEHADNLAIEDEPGELTSDDEGLIMLVSANLWSFKALEEKYKEDSAFKDFRKRFQVFLSTFLATYTEVMPSSTPHFREEEEVSHICLFAPG